MNELDTINWLRARLQMSRDVILGPGDDCALLDVSADSVLAATADTLLEGTHFRAEDDPRLIGWKAAAVNLSDLAAMGCRPRWGFTGLGLRRGTTDAWLREFSEGLIGCAERFGLCLAGGDFTTGDGPTSITLTALGSPFAGGPLRRSGARAGDILAVTGTLGGSLAGKHLSFTPRLAESEWLCGAGGVTAMMDISDGLALDLRRLCAESKCGAVVDAEQVPVSEAAREMARAELNVAQADSNVAQAPRLEQNLGGSPSFPAQEIATSGSPTLSAPEIKLALNKALCDGEDFELLLAVAPPAWAKIAREFPYNCGIKQIGTFVPGGGLKLRTRAGETDFPEGGYVHV